MIQSESIHGVYVLPSFENSLGRFLLNLIRLEQPAYFIQLQWLIRLINVLLMNPRDRGGGLK